MKNLIIAALALTVATPALAANDKLAASVGVDAGQYTLEQLATLKGLESASAGEARVHFEGNGTGVVNDVAARKFQELAAEDNAGFSTGTYVPQTSRGPINDVAAQKFRELRAE